MSDRFYAGEPIATGMRRLAHDQIARALGELEDPELDLHETVHQVHKRCKKLRGLLRLVRPALAGDTWSRENAALRDAQRLLSDLRDAAAHIETLDALLASGAGRVDTQVVETARAELMTRRERSAGWELEGDGFGAVGPGITDSYRRADTLPLGRRLFADPPKVIRRRLGVWLDVAWSEARATGP